VNDLIGLHYGWGNAPSDGSGKTDCFQLVCEVRQRLGLTSYTDKFAWVYDSYVDETFPRRMIVRWLLEHGRRINAPRHGAVVLLPGLAGAALATALDGDVLFIAPSQNVVRSQLPEGIGHYFWMDR
jgi:hypothetical protein